MHNNIICLHFYFFVTPRIRMPSLFMHTSALLSQKKIKWVIKFTKSWKMFGTADSAVFLDESRKTKFINCCSIPKADHVQASISPEELRIRNGEYT